MEATRYFEARNDNKTLIIDDNYKNFALKEIISPVKYSIKDEYQLVNYDTTALNTITYNKLRKLISKKLDIETTIAYN